MTVFRCKMCGGNLQVVEGTSYCTCDSCGTMQTIPKVQDEGLKNLFNRANALRMKAEFDRATELYEKILQKNDKEAEAYWGLILCKYGIEYVEDPATFKQVPTCHRASYDAVVSDEDYKNALRYADDQQKKIYEKEAAEIDEIQKGILALAQKESPYDVFICYKETDEDGKRTQDSVLANDIYHQLTNEGLKVFYAAITLEDKLGKEYEPYIFSALHSAKVMLVLGTKPEYFSAVWVRNEWSRFLKIMKKDHSRLLIPCYRDMDPYELPDEFAHLQAQDMSKIGFITDLIRGIKKVIAPEPKEQPGAGTPVVQQNTINPVGNAEALYERGMMALEDYNWEKAVDFFEKALNQNARYAQAYIGEFLAQYHHPSYAVFIRKNIGEVGDTGKTTLQAGEADEQHIQEMVEKNVVRGYLNERTIQEEYKGFSFAYGSVLTSRKAQKENKLKRINSNILWSRAEQYADPELKKQLRDDLDKIERNADELIVLAEKEDAEEIARVQREYKKFLEEADLRVEKLHTEALEKIEKEYQQTVSLVEKAESFWEYTTARNMAYNLDGYKDCLELVKKCDEGLAKINEEEMEKEKLRAQKKKRKRIKTAIEILIAAIAAAILWVIFVNPKLEQRKQEKARQDRAMVSEELKKIKETGLSEGSTVEFGTYKQAEYAEDDESIEWTVLSKEGDKVLLLSNKVLAKAPYNDRYNRDGDKLVTWENCSLRKWLNKDFYKRAFTEAERSCIVESTLETEIYEEGASEIDLRTHIDRRIETEDKVFLLSALEAEEYFDSDEELLRMPTEAADIYTWDNEYVQWWLRTKGRMGNSYTMYVRKEAEDGEMIDQRGESETSTYDTGVCPAIWLDLSALEE